MVIDCGGYLYRLAQTAAAKAWRNRIGNNGEITAEQVGIAEDPTEKATDDDTMRVVRQKIAELPTKQGRAIIMRYLEVKDYKRIASELKCSAEAARSNVSKALVGLKRMLADE
jgi:RNA polymerase sigma factor (sigma-70 family)